MSFSHRGPLVDLQNLKGRKYVYHYIPEYLCLLSLNYRDVFLRWPQSDEDVNLFLMYTYHFLPQCVSSSFICANSKTICTCLGGFWDTWCRRTAWRSCKCIFFSFWPIERCQCEMMVCAELLTRKKLIILIFYHYPDYSVTVRDKMCLLSSAP